MSHFSTYVILSSRPSDLLAAVSVVLEPWNEESYPRKAKWDWFQLGGRWTGVLGDYNPATDPKNIGTCEICQGTGKRDDALGRETRTKDPAYTCNGCDGKGKRVAWPTTWGMHSSDVQPVAKLLDIKDNQMPFAMVTPDGKWHERGKMGWFASVRDEMPREEWNKRVRELLAKHAEAIVVVVDCHI